MFTLPMNSATKRVARELVDLVRRAHLHDAALVHHADARGERHRLFLIVRDDDEGDAELLLDVHQLELRVLAQLLVQRAERLIEQQQLRALDERARQRHALPLAAGKLVRLALLEAAAASPSPASRRRGWRSPRFGTPSCFRPNATFCSTVMCGNSA